MSIVELLEYKGAIGKDNAITTAQIKLIMNTKTTRDVTQAVELARDDGYIICSCMTNEGGYFLPATIEEAKSYLKTQGHRLRNSARRYHKARRKIASFEESAHQENLFDKEESSVMKS